MQALQTRHIRFGDFEIDVVRRRLLRNGQALQLNSKTFDLLLALVEHHGQVLSKEELLDLVWEGQFVEEGNLKVHISNLRKVFGERRGEHRFIVTVPGRGYSFVAELERDEPDQDLIIETHSVSRILVDEEIGDEHAIADTPQPLALNPAARSTSKSRIALALAVALIVLGGGGYLIFRSFSAKAARVPFQHSSIKRLTTVGTVGSATISADGKLFVYSVHEGDQESLWLGHVDGGEPVEIRTPAHVVYLSLKFDPDGSSIYYTTSENFSNGTLYKMPILGGPAQKIRDDSRDITFARDGKQFAYLKSVSDEAALFIANADGSNERQVALLPRETGADWHSDAWSPDGAHIALAATVGADESRGFVLNVADGSVKPFSDHGWRSIRAMSWLHDGSGVIVVAVEKDSILPQLSFVAYPSGEVQRVTTDLSLYGLTTSSLTDDSILSVAGFNQSNVWVAPSDDLSQSKQITFGSPGQNAGWNGIAFAPDNRIVYSAENNQGMTLWTMDADGRDQKQLIPAGGVNNYPSVTSDGRYLVFQSNRGGHFAVWRADVNGENIMQLTGDTPAGRPYVSPDGKWIVYINTSAGAGALWRMKIDGSEPTQLVGDNADWAQISPDSRSVAFEYRDHGASKLAIMQLDASQPMRIFDAPRLANFRLGVHWSPDGRSVTYRDWADGLWRQPIDGGQPAHLAGLPKEKLFGFAFSPDGRQLAFTRGSEIRDVVLIGETR